MSYDREREVSTIKRVKSHLSHTRDKNETFFPLTLDDKSEFWL